MDDSDRMKSFETYYPKGNIQNVLKFLNLRRIKNQRISK